MPEGYKQERFQVKGVPVEHLIPETKNDLVIYHLHGGGYAFRYMDAYRDVALQYSKAAGGAEVFSIDYGCAPNHVFPSALEESISVYEWLLSEGYDANKIIIMGDSAGGNLTLVTTMYLRDHKMPLPKAVITISPWASLDPCFPSRETNATKDLLLGSGYMRGIAENPPYAGETDLKTPYLSPVYGEFYDFPMMLIQCGSYEILLDEITEVANKAKEAGVDVTFTAYPGMSHDFQLMLPMLDESEQAWKEIREFFSKVAVKQCTR